MKKVVFVLLVLLLIPMHSFSQDSKTIVIKNETGYEINDIYFSPSAFDDWADDFLMDETLQDGESIEITLDRDFDLNEMIYDLQAVDEDDDYYTMYEIDIESEPVVSITMDAYDGGDYGDYDDYDYSGYEEGYNDGYSEGYKLGYTEAFRDAFLEGFRAAQEMDFIPPAGETGTGNTNSGGWR